MGEAMTSPSPIDLAEIEARREREQLEMLVRVAQGQGWKAGGHWVSNIAADAVQGMIALLARLRASEEERDYYISMALDAIALDVRALAQAVQEAVEREDNLLASLKHAVEIIKQYVPRDALGHNSDGDLTESHLTRSWPLLDEYLHYMNEAISASETAAAIRSKGE